MRDYDFSQRPIARQAIYAATLPRGDCVEIRREMQEIVGKRSSIEGAIGPSPMDDGSATAG
ncbi:hypothetical protein SSE37_01950 [Sagittula stellata E-37]|uniref:Uncharacterized protein n=1 Tax=Sagittula stellata (strain ATCC 700073 / DSM 11524 / E-37) TaxID=388399 RepID=A3K4S8_SAGS3|nr:hypothetical protein SSE37_01950 [Sagittula stellata E-37]